MNRPLLWFDEVPSQGLYGWADVGEGRVEAMEVIYWKMS